jgi:hypothetical protein
MQIIEFATELSRNCHGTPVPLAREDHSCQDRERKSMGMYLSMVTDDRTTR